MSADTGHSAGAWLCFASDHPALAGHFPQRPIVPGVLLLDETLHTLEQALGGDRAREGAHWHIAHVKFHRPVTPGQQLRLEWQDDAQTRESQGEGHGAGEALRHRVQVALHVGQHLVMSAALERRDP